MSLNSEVQQKIERAKKENLTELDLSVRGYWLAENDDKKLTQIPVEVFELQQLKVLNLRGNSIPEIPEQINQLRNLKSLNLSSNQLSKIPKSLENLTNLTSLDLL
ncbi:MAG TPA: hypothetical protein DCF68_21220 [Cyanothece sp. UBA12306]|nr:hypothetical protein [Cyanothece sp. UBA12306]